MYDKILADASLPSVLWALDRELAAEVKARGCIHCHGPLDVADYIRKPRCGPLELEEAHCRRLSLCCRREGCRRRTTPPSVRFLGRRVYLSVVVVLVGVLRQGPTPWRVAKLSQVLGVNRRTLVRWRHFWIVQLGGSRTFELARADFMPPPECAYLPRSLVECFTGTATERVLRALSWLAAHFGSRFPKGGGGHAELAR